jgi:hypothetical protein
LNAGPAGPKGLWRDYDGEGFRLRRDHLDDYAAGRVSLCLSIIDQLDEAGLLPDHWRSRV